MLQGIIVLLITAAVVVALLLGFRRSREWMVEQLKAGSDSILVSLLRLTSRFGSELTPRGRLEQGMWREQRLRNLRGLALRSSRARPDKSEAEK